MKKEKNSNADLEELTSQLARKEETGQKSQRRAWPKPGQPKSS
jgi:hypothetical protein